jgi:hypothetical protein
MGWRNARTLTRGVHRRRSRLIVGPVLMSLAVAILRLYATEARKRRAQLRELPPASVRGDRVNCAPLAQHAIEVNAEQQRHGE